MVWCIAHISGGHVNPAVTIAALITRRVSVVRAFFYLVAQLVGALIGAGLLRPVVKVNDIKTTLGEGQSTYKEHSIFTHDYMCVSRLKPHVFTDFNLMNILFNEKYFIPR
jgi:glycerol uptake facilitator-like aquaporin